MFINNISIISISTAPLQNSLKVLTHFLSHFPFARSTPTWPTLPSPWPVGLWKLNVDDSSTFLWKLSAGLSVRVVHCEVGDDDRYRQSNCQYTSQCTQGSHKHAQVSLRSHVSIAHCCHGDQSPPQSQWYGIEIVMWISLKVLTK